MLWVDAGDFTGEEGRPGQMQTDTLVEAMNALDYQVVNLSQRELAHGFDVLEARRKKATFQFVSANIVWQDTGEPLVAGSVVRTVALRQGARVPQARLGFLGLTRNNPAFLKEGPAGRRIVTVDPFAAAEKEAAALRGKCDVLVALAALDLNEARLLAKRVKDLDLILGVDGSVVTRSDDFPEDTQIGRTRLFGIGDQGKIVGEVRLFFNEKGAIASTQRAAVGLTREWPENAAFQKMQDDTKAAVNEVNRAQAAGPGAGGPIAPPFGAAPAAPQSPPGPPAYTGSERCRPCHAGAFATWERSAHSRAFATLVRAQQDFNPNCVGCHSVGYGKPQGFVNAQATPSLVNVGCESCHGPSGRHPGDGAPGYGRLDTSFCVTCHTRENSPDFNPATYVPKVRHWSEGAPGR